MDDEFRENCSYLRSTTVDGKRVTLEIEYIPQFGLPKGILAAFDNIIAILNGEK